mmetsp:Transcript_25823/g.36062  ORF Transcript_25823/g.36062 Transcript_25823/m.36062 type:complete len:232 (+) Transcript_25823:46-741(+)
MLKGCSSKIQPRRKCKEEVHYMEQKMSFAHPKKKPLKKAIPPRNARRKPEVDIISCLDGSQKKLRQKDGDDPETLHFVDADSLRFAEMFIGEIEEAAIGTALALSSFGMRRKRLQVRGYRRKLMEVERKRKSILREAAKQNKENDDRHRRKRRKSSRGKKRAKPSFSNKPCPGCQVKVFDDEMWKLGTIKSVTKVGAERDERLRWLLEIQFAAGDKGRFEFPDQDIKLHYA